MYGLSEKQFEKTFVAAGKMQGIHGYNLLILLESRLDKPGIKKYYRKLTREGKSKKEILELMQSKYEVTKQEARSLYREFKNTKNNGQ